MAARTGTIGRDILGRERDADRYEYRGGLLARIRGRDEIADGPTEDADTIDGTGGADALYGLGGNDLLNCLGANDYGNGGAGNDRVNGHGGDDDLYGEAGADTLIGDFNIDYLDGGDGADRLLGGDGNEGTITITHDATFGITNWSFLINNIHGGMIGYAGADTIYGGEGNDVGLGGYDVDAIYGEGGNDLLFGGAGVDAVFGGDGHDVLGGDTRAGFNFSDPTIVGGPGGDDYVSGGIGDDIIFGGAGSDELDGGEGDGIDYIYGSMDNASNTPQGYTDSHDFARGRGGNDVLRGGEGDDTLLGEKDDDNLRGDLGDDTLDGGAGIDLASYRFDDIGLTSGIEFSADEVGTGPEVFVDDGRGGTDRLIGIEFVQIIGSTFDDTLTAGFGDDVVFGNEGADDLIGLDGNDTLDGGGGEDILNGGLGRDELIGGDGLDVVNYKFDLLPNVFSGVLFDGHAFGGPARTKLSGDIIGIDFLEGIERLDIRGSDYADTITATRLDDTVDGGLGNDSVSGDLGGDLLTGEQGKDTLSGDQGDDALGGDKGDDVLNGGNDSDTLNGGDGLDALNGGKGDDELRGGAELDTLAGGLGDDTYYLEDADLYDVVIEGANQGYDAVISRLDYEMAEHVEQATLEEGGAGREVQGNKLDNLIVGNSARNFLDGGRGDDELFGEGGDDVLTAKAGEDTLTGGEGDDTYSLLDARVVVVENEDEGKDTIESKVSLALGDHIENLTLYGPGDKNGIGNELDNLIKGNDGRNDLVGGDGDDTLIGGIGGDTLRPGVGEDVLKITAPSHSIGAEYDLVIGADFDGEDRIDLGALAPSAISTLNQGVLRQASFEADLDREIDDSALDAFGAVLFNPSGGDFEAPQTIFLIVDANGDGDYDSFFDYVIAFQGSFGALGTDDFI